MLTRYALSGKTRLVGNDLYIGMPNTVIWLGNVAGGFAGQTLASTYIDPSAGVSNLGMVAVDNNDPANLVLYSGDDTSGAAMPGDGRLFHTIQTAAAPAPPAAPQNVVASIANGPRNCFLSATINFNGINNANGTATLQVKVK
jgi:hypothetical protein